MSIFRIVLAILSVALQCACSLDANLENYKLSQLDGDTPLSLVALKPEGSLIHTSYDGISAVSVNSTPLFNPSASPPAVITANAKSLGDVTTIAAPSLQSDIKPFIRHPNHDAPQAASGTPKTNFTPSDLTPLVPTLGTSTGSAPPTSCTFATPMPNSTCSWESLAVSLQDISTGTLSVQFNNGQNFNLPMQRYRITQLELGAPGKRVASNSEAREAGGPFTMDLVNVGEMDYSSARTYLRQSDAEVRLIYSRPISYDFLKVVAVMPNTDLVFYSGYKPTVDRMGLFVSNKAMTFFRMVANLNPASDDLSMFGRIQFVEYRNKIYFSLYYGSYQFKLFRMDLDATNVEQVTNFIPGGTDEIGSMVEHNGKLYFTARIDASAGGAGKLFFLTTDTNGNNLAISRFPARNSAGTDVGTLHSINGRLYANWSSDTETGLHWIHNDHSQITKITEFADNYSFEIHYAGNAVLANMTESLSDDRNSLFLFDTTQNQFTLLADIRPAGNGYDWKASEIASIGERIFFKHRAPAGGSQILSTAQDGSNLRVETALSSIDEMVILGDRLFFLGFSGSNDKLYSISATKGGDLQQHSDLNPGGPDFVRSGNGLELYRRNDSTLLLAWDADAFEIKLDE